MREALRSVKWSLILASLLYLVLGVALLFWPDTSNLILCYLIAAVLTAYGAFQVIAFFGREGGSWIGLIIGIICAGFGVYALIQPTGISDIISIILGFVIVVDGALSLRLAAAGPGLSEVVGPLSAGPGGVGAWPDRCVQPAAVCPAPASGHRCHSPL